MSNLTTAYAVLTYNTAGDLTPDTMEIFLTERDANDHATAVHMYYDEVKVKKVPLYTGMSETAKHYIETEIESLNISIETANDLKRKKRLSYE